MTSQEILPADYTIYCYNEQGNLTMVTSEYEPSVNELCFETPQSPTQLALLFPNSPKPDVFVYRNDGTGMHRALAGYVAQTGEQVFANEQTAEQLAAAFSNYTSTITKQNITVQIFALEATQTLRRMRDTSPSGVAWLVNLETQIAALRAQL